MKKLIVLLAGVLFLQTANAQIFKKIGDKINRTVNNTIDNKIDKVVNKTAQKVEEAVTKPAKKSGKDKSKSDTAQISSSKNMEVNEKAERTAVSTQDCDQATLLQTPGKWIKGRENPSYGINPAYLAKMKVNLASIHSMIQQNYKPYGADADYNNVYSGGRLKPKYPVSYTYSIYVMKYYCEGNAIKKSHETNTTLNIIANSYNSLNISEEEVVGAAAEDGFYSLPGHVEQHEDYLKWTEEVSLGFGMDGLQTNWLVTYNNQLPFSFVTKKEFLEKKKQIVLAALAKWKDDQKNNETLKRIEDELKNSESELNKPAVIANPDPYKPFVFANKSDTKYVQTLIKLNLAYFNLKIPLTSPQFFTIGLKGDHKNDISKKAMKDIEAAIDFKKLKSMLGK